MYGEPRAIRAVAERLEGRADELRARADELVARSEAVPWVSLAAERMRAAAREQGAGLRAVATAYDDAAARVREHAARVADLLERIAEIERRARALIADAADRASRALGDLAGGIKDALTPGDQDDRRVAATPTPPPGHRDWLDLAAFVTRGRS